MNSPLGSPRLAASTAKFRNKVPTQVRRCVPLYFGCVFIILLILNFDIFYSVPNPIGVFRREQYQLQTSRQLPGHTFPQKIWQTWKTDALMFGIKDTSRAMTWLGQNPGMRYEVITDYSDKTYIQQFFGPHGLDRPDIVNFYNKIELPIIKADLLRYMIMYAEGGIYADIDVEAIKPFHRFFPERHHEEDIDIIVGIEIDQPQYKDHPILGDKSMSFCQWTIISKPGHPVFLRLIENIMKWFTRIAKDQGVPLNQVELDFDQVISGTGPTAFTKALLAEMSKETKSKVEWDTFHRLDESKVVGRVLVLTVEAFCAGQGHSDSGNHGSRGALVRHHYHASNWPSRHRRYNHPAYGQIEECNWRDECIKEWDRNVAEYETLSEEQKQEKVKERLALLNG